MPVEEPSFYNWQHDRDVLRRMFTWPLEGLIFDIERNDLWLEGWGPKPESLNARKRRVTELVKHAPRLIPVYGVSYLLAEPCISGNPVFAAWQDDVIVDGENLRSYFLSEFADVLGLNRSSNLAEVDEEIRAVRFWGELIVANQAS